MKRVRERERERKRIERAKTREKKDGKFGKRSEKDERGTGGGRDRGVKSCACRRNRYCEIT